MARTKVDVFIHDRKANTYAVQSLTFNRRSTAYTYVGEIMLGTSYKVPAELIYITKFKNKADTTGILENAYRPPNERITKDI